MKIEVTCFHMNVKRKREPSRVGRDEKKLPPNRRPLAALRRENASTSRGDREAEPVGGPPGLELRMAGKSSRQF